MITILVCGGRGYKDKEKAFRALYSVSEVGCMHGEPRGFTIVTGGATGADALAGEWAALNNATLKVYPPNWNLHGRAAGPIRNQEMIDKERIDFVIAFPGGKGTLDMVTRAKNKNIKVIEIK